MSSAYKVKISAFEGPLDLLLHLIKQHEIDIYDISVSEIAKQYTKYIHTMQYLELNIASEYLVMAATLLSIKSQMLLPKPQIDDVDEYEEDPREALINRLIEYRQYKEAAMKLQEKEKDAKQIFTRTPVSLKELEEKAPIEKGSLSIYDMLGALDQMLERKMWDEPLETKVMRVEIPIEQRMYDIVQKVENLDRGISFDELFVYESKSHIVVTFIAILELMKNNDIYCQQDDHFDLLYVYPSKELMNKE